MSRIAKWNLEKAKVKVVFRLQFHATHIPHAGWDKLFVSFIPVDSGKATAKTSKCNVRNGTCKWADPIYETTRLLQNMKTKRYDEKLYKLVVAMGSSRSSLLGEANINLADFADATKPSAVALPLHGCNNGTVLHVIVQLLTSKTGFREFEQQRELREGGLETTNIHSIHDESAEKLPAHQFNKVNSKARFKSDSSELPSLVEDRELKEDSADSAIGIDDSSNTSESLYTERNDSNTHEIDSQKSTISGDLGVIPFSRGHSKELDPPGHRLFASESNYLVHGWSSDYSVDIDQVTVYEENNRLRGSLEVAESSLLELKLEMSSLQGHAVELCAETEKFSQLLAKEMASGEELGKEVFVLKSECSKFKDDIEKLKQCRLSPFLNGRETIAVNQDHLLQDLQKRCLQCLLALEVKVSEVQNKACLKYDDMDSNFLQPDLDALQHVLQDLKQKAVVISSLLNVEPAEQAFVKEIKPFFVQEHEQIVPRDKLSSISGQYQYEDNFNCSRRCATLSQETDSTDVMRGFEGKISDLQKELEESRTERDSLTRKMDQMECYYEALVQELEENQKQMLGELQTLRNEHSTCMYTITSCNTQIDKMHEDMSEQLLRFSEDRHALESHNKELERRAINSETALEKARWNYSIAVDQLQKDLELLSFQVLSMFETNEKLMRHAFADTSPCLVKEHEEKSEGSCHRIDPLLTLDHMVSPEKAEEKKNVEFDSDIIVVSQSDLDGRNSLNCREGETYNANLSPPELFTPDLQHCRNQNAELKRELLDQEMHLEILKRSHYLQEVCYEKAESELGEMYYMHINLDVLSKVLQGSLNELNNDFNLMKREMIELEHQVAHSAESNKLLMLRLQDCIAEKTELVNLLNQEASEKYSLKNEVSSVLEELKELKAGLNHQSTAKRNLEITVSSLQDKLLDLRSTMISYGEQMNEPSLPSKPLQQELEKTDFTSIILQVQVLQQQTHEKIRQLLCEKKDAEEQRDIAQRSLSDVKSEILLSKQKYESDIYNIVNKLNTTNALVDKLQIEIGNITNKLKSSAKDEERNAEQLMEISSKLALSEFVVQQVCVENNDLAKKILALESINKELERSKLIVVDSSRENQTLTMSLQVGNEKVINLENELCSLKENLKHSSDELVSERSLRGEMEGKITLLISELDMRNDQLNSEKAQVVHLMQLVSDLEVEKSTVCNNLLHSKESRKKADEYASLLRLKFTDLENQLAASHKCVLASDVEVTCMRNQFQTRIKELVQQLESLDRCYRELHLKHLDVLNTLNGRISTEAQYVEENARTLTALNFVRSELEAAISDRNALVDQNNIMLVELENYKAKEAISVESDILDNHQYTVETEQLKHMLLSSEDAIDNLWFARDELEITITVLRAKFDEHHALIRLLEEYGNEVLMLRTQKNELSQRLSDQILKTEEFKNLSIHLKELKDEADSECLQARERKETATPLNSSQESLRIAFIREQCETKLQELKGQLYISKKHGEEMMLKLQDALTEVENRKKHEASYAKRIDELSLKILELEAQLHTVLAENRICDEMKAALECSRISLECCKEEKQKLETSLKECIKERVYLSDELGSLKLQHKSFKFPITIEEEGKLLEPLIPEPVTKAGLSEELDGCQGHMQDDHTSRSVLRIQRQVIVDEEDINHLALINERFKTKSLRSSMDHLHEQLEMMKNENSGTLPQDAKHFELAFHGLQRQLFQLHKANEQLRSIFPLYNEYSSSGNALERVLALEIELAEALQGKKKSDIHFQSSFLNQQPDEAAVLQSFRDINELIKDMLELKGRHTAVETELKEMHDRYSHLSLQFAEVEGERQKLVMTLKNVRSPKKTLLLCNSMPASSLEENV